MNLEPKRDILIRRSSVTVDTVVHLKPSDLFTNNSGDNSQLTKQCSSATDFYFMLQLLEQHKLHCTSLKLLSIQL